MDATLTGSHLDTRIKICILTVVIVPKLEYAEVWQENAKLVKQLETVHMIAAKKILGCSSTASNTVLRAELGMYQPKTNRDVRKLKWQYKVRNLPEKRLPAIADRAVWEKITKGRAGIEWDNVVEKIWKDLGDQEHTVHEKKWRVQDRSKSKDRRKGKASAKKSGERGETLGGVRGVEGRCWDENVFARPNGLREKAETAISCRGPGPTRKKKEINQ